MDTSGRGIRWKNKRGDTEADHSFFLQRLGLSNEQWLPLKSKLFVMPLGQLFDEHTLYRRVPGVNKAKSFVMAIYELAYSSI
jgi:hypothetical protein